MNDVYRWLRTGMRASGLLLVLACGSDDKAGGGPFPSDTGGVGPGVLPIPNGAAGAAGAGTPPVDIPQTVGPVIDQKAEVKALPIGREFACDPAVISHPPKNLVIRLSSWEYQNSIRDLFGVDVSTASIPDGDPEDREFNNLGAGATREHSLAFAKLASDAASGTDMTALLARYGGACDDFGAACVDSFIRNLGKAVLRGPVVDVEFPGFQKIYATAKEQELSFAEGTKYFIQTLLQSPRFIYRIEREAGDGAARALSGFELASRVSYAVWGSTPDAELLSQAEAGTLAGSLEAQLDRMLADPRAEAHAVHFFDDWMDLHRAEDSGAVTAVDPDFNEDLLQEMREETLSLFRNLLKNNLPIASIHNAQRTQVSESLASYYGYTRGADGSVDLSSVPERSGLMTHASMASLGGSEGSTVRKGLHMLEQVLCGRIGSPPPGTDTTPTPAAEGQTIRQSSEGRLARQPCGGCHEQFEPMVWGLTRFDAAGKYSPKDKFGGELPEDGWVIFPDDPGTKHMYANVAELTELLGNSKRVRDCAALKLSEYVSRTSPKAPDACSLQGVRNRLEQGNGSYREIVKALILGENFNKILTENVGAAQ